MVGLWVEWEGRHNGVRWVRSLDGPHPIPVSHTLLGCRDSSFRVAISGVEVRPTPYFLCLNFNRYDHFLRPRVFCFGSKFTSLFYFSSVNTTSVTRDCLGATLSDDFVNVFILNVKRTSSARW